jgi:hypothetical protein
VKLRFLVEYAATYVEDVPALFSIASSAPVGTKVRIVSSVTGNTLCDGEIKSTRLGWAAIRVEARASWSPRSHLSLQPGGRVR